MAFSLNKPLDVIAEAGGLFTRSGLLDDVRTVLADKGHFLRMFPTLPATA